MNEWEDFPESYDLDQILDFFKRRQDKNKITNTESETEEDKNKRRLEEYTQREELKKAKRENAEAFNKIRFSDDAINLHDFICSEIKKAKHQSNVKYQINDYEERHFLDRADNALSDNDIEELDSILSSICEPSNKRYLFSYRNYILKEVGCKYYEIESALNEITTVGEADIVYGAVVGSQWITSLKNTPNEKKPKYRNRFSRFKGFEKTKYQKKFKNSKTQKVTYNYCYPDQLKLQKKLLEKQLMKETKTGRKRSERISKILDFLHPSV